MEADRSAPERATATPFRVVVADDHEAFRDGLVRRLDRDRRFDVVATAGSGRTAASAIVMYRPNVAVLDLRLPTLDALAVWLQVRRADAALAQRIMVLTATPNDARARETRASINGPVSDKNRSRRDIADEIAAFAQRGRLATQ